MAIKELMRSKFQASISRSICYCKRKKQPARQSNVPNCTVQDKNNFIRNKKQQQNIEFKQLGNIFMNNSVQNNSKSTFYVQKTAKNQSTSNPRAFNTSQFQGWRRHLSTFRLERHWPGHYCQLRILQAAGYQILLA